MERSLFRKFYCIVTLAAFLVTGIVTPSYTQALMPLSAPDAMVALSPAFHPATLKGVRIDPGHPLEMDFIVDSGDDAGVYQPNESIRLIKYFLAALTVPENDLWVNLSPYEKDRVVANGFDETEMGRDLLAQDYLLKQITASVMYPEGETGKAFWQKIYAAVFEKYGNIDIPVDAFSKVWIVPARAVVYENATALTAYVAESGLKVMLETDYLAMAHTAGAVIGSVDRVSQSTPDEVLTRNILRGIIIPVIQKEVNEGRNFAPLRQIYHSIILARWYKRTFAGRAHNGSGQLTTGIHDVSLRAYIDQKKTDSLACNDAACSPPVEKTWANYAEAFRSGVYNFIKEEVDPLTRESVAKKYFAGGASFSMAQMDAAMSVTTRLSDIPAADNTRAFEVKVALQPIDNAALVQNGSDRKRNELIHIYQGAEYRDNKVVGGKRITSNGINRKDFKQFVKENPGFSGIFTGVLLGSEGGFTWNERLYWTARKKYCYAPVTIIVTNGELVAVYDKDNQCLFPFVENYIYLGSDYEDGKPPVNPGGALDRSNMREIVESYGSFTGTIDKVRLDSLGGFVKFLGKSYWFSMEGMKYALVRVVMIANEVVAVYAEDGTRLYPFENNIYSVKEDKGGKLIRDELLTPVGLPNRDAINKWLKNNPGRTVRIQFRLPKKGGLEHFNLGILEKWRFEEKNLDLDSLLPVLIRKGNVSADGRVIKNIERTDSEFQEKFWPLYTALKECLDGNYWATMPGMGKKWVDIVLRDGFLTTVYDEQGNQVYPYQENFLYLGAQYVDGKIVGGRLINSRGASGKKAVNRILKYFPGFNGVIARYRVGASGALNYLNGSEYGGDRQGMSRELTTIVMEHGHAVSGYRNSDRRRFYSAFENRVYSGVTVENGKRVGGILLNEDGFHSRERLNDLLVAHSGETEFIENVQLSPLGVLGKIGDKEYYDSFPGHENEFVNVLREDGEVVALHDEQGVNLYAERKYIFYAGAKMENRKIVGGVCLTPRGLLSKNDMNRFLKGKHPAFTGMIDKVLISGMGALGRVNGKQYYIYLPGYEGKLVAVHFLNGRVVNIYNEHGLLIWGENNEARIRGVLEQLWSSGDFGKLVSLFGGRSAERILFNLLSNSTPHQIIRFSREYVEKLSGVRRKGAAERERVPFSGFLRKVSDVGIFSTEVDREAEQIFTRELFHSIYAYVTEDRGHQYLQELKLEAEREGIHPVIQRAFVNILKTFDEVGRFDVQGIRASSQLMFYQKIGIKFILDVKRALLADQPGLGKTIQALGAAVNAFDGRGARKVLIICPKVAIIDIWRRQISRHLKGDQKVAVVRTRLDFNFQKKRSVLNNARFVIVNYDLLVGEPAKGLREQLKKQGFDFIIVDEAHRLRNNSKITKAVLEFDAPYKLLLTASVIKGRNLGKLYNLLRWLYPEKYSDRNAFLKKGGSREGFRRLRAELREFTLRRYTSDVLRGMPKVTVEYRPVQLAGEQALVYRDIERHLMIRLNNPDAPANLLPVFSALIRAAIDASLIRRVFITDQDTGKKEELIPGITYFPVKGKTYQVMIDGNRDAVFIWNKVADITARRLIELPKKKGLVEIEGKNFVVEIQEREAPSAKYAALDRIVDDVIDQKKERLVVATGVVNAAYSLKKRYEARGIRVLVITGNTKSARRDEILKEFQRSTEPLMLVFTYQTLGESSELFNAHYGVILDSPWLDRDQVIGRLARIGQKDPVTFYIIQALNTIDGHIDQINWQSEAVQKLVLDDFWGMHNSRNALMQLYMSQSANEKKEKDLLKKFRARILAVEVSPESANPPSTVEMREGNEHIRFDGDNFTARLDNIGIDNMADLFKNAGSLNQSARKLLKEFIIKRFEVERVDGVKIKESLLWHILQEIVPGFRNIDYDGRVEFIVELGRHILQRLLQDPDITKLDILGDRQDIPDHLYEQTMYYLQRANVFRLFALMGIVPPLYYRGELLRYDSPIHIGYKAGAIQYYDDKIVESIAPGWRVKDQDIAEGKVGFIRDTERVRLLTEEEEFLLAQQLAEGNNAAGDVLIGAHLRDTIAIARKEASSEEYNRRVHGVIEREQLYQEGANALISLVRAYARNEVYETMSFDEYLADRLPVYIRVLAKAIVRQISELSIDEKIFEGSHVTDKDLLRSDSQPQDGMSERETLSLFEGLLRSQSFIPEEIALLSLFALKGDTEEELAERLAGNYGRQVQDSDSEYIGALIARFRLSMGLLGRAGVLDALNGGGLNSKDTDDAMSPSAPGGIDLREGSVTEVVHEPSSIEEIEALDTQPSALMSSTFTGLTPIILNVTPVQSRADWLAV